MSDCLHWILTREISDGSDFSIYGFTDSRLVARAWVNASHTGETKAYPMRPNDLCVTGHPAEEKP